MHACHACLEHRPGSARAERGAGDPLPLQRRVRASSLQTLVTQTSTTTSRRLWITWPSLKCYDRAALPNGPSRARSAFTAPHRDVLGECARWAAVCAQAVSTCMLRANSWRPPPPPRTCMDSRVPGRRPLADGSMSSCAACHLQRRLPPQGANSPAPTFAMEAKNRGCRRVRSKLHVAMLQFN